MTSTQLFKMVECNDYEGLEKLINSNQKIDFNVYRSGHSLLSKAIQVRARECFDLIMEIPNYKYLTNTTNTYGGNGLAQILEYFSIAPNPSNEYYLNRLLEKNITIGSNIKKAINNPELFNKMLFKFLQEEGTNKNSIISLIYSAIDKNNFNIAVKLLEHLDNVILVNSSQTEKINTYNFILNDAIIKQNIQLVDFIITNKNISISQIQSDINNCPPLYSSFYKKNNLMFNYFYQLYQKLSPLELNLINGIESFNFNTSYNDILKTNFAEAKEYLDKIFSLPIEFYEFEKIILKLFGTILNSHMTYHIRYYNKKLNIAIDEICKIMHYFYKSGKIKSNPFVHFVLSVKQFNSDLDGLTKTFSTKPELIEPIKVFCRKTLYISKHHNWEPTETVKGFFDKSFTAKQLEDFETDKTNYINQLEAVTNVQIKVKKPRVTKKKQNTDIEV